MVWAVYSCSLSVAVVVEDSEDVNAVVSEDWEGEGVAEGVSDPVLSRDRERAEADILDISCVDFGLYAFVSVLTFSFLLES